MSKKHINIPIFVPHLGCPNNCVFCNQHTISGTRDFVLEDVEKIIDEHIDTINLQDSDVQIAFFGGSFTAIDRDLMIKLLEIGNRYIKENKVQSLRCSTRPDCIDENILDTLIHYGMRNIELGIQSMNDDVLKCCNRGHTTNDSIKACEMINSKDELILGGQMMTGLPSSDKSKDIFTSKKLCEMGCKEARIYPTMVFRYTELEKMMQSGEYTPPSKEELIDISSLCFKELIDHNIKVLRIGLPESQNLHSEEGIVSNNHEPAMGEMVISRYYRSHIEEKIKEFSDISDKILLIECQKSEISPIIGYKKCNLEYFTNNLPIKTIKLVENDSILRYNIKVNLL